MSVRDFGDTWNWVTRLRSSKKSKGIYLFILLSLSGVLNDLMRI